MDSSLPQFKYYLGCDHAGFDLKEVIKTYLNSKNLIVEDLGVYTADRCDYPDLAAKVAQEVAKNNNHRGILVCGSGIGISIAANKFRGARCGLCHDDYSLKRALEAYCNIISLGGRVIGDKLALSIVESFVAKANYVEDEKYKEVMKGIALIEEKYYK